MDYQFITILTGFIALLFTVINTSNSLRKEIKEDIKESESRLNKRIDFIEADLRVLTAKIDTLIMALFKQNLSIPNNQENKDAA